MRSRDKDLFQKGSKLRGEGPNQEGEGEAVRRIDRGPGRKTKEKQEEELACGPRSFLLRIVVAEFVLDRAKHKKKKKKAEYSRMRKRMKMRTKKKKRAGRDDPLAVPFPPTGPAPPLAPVEEEEGAGPPRAVFIDVVVVVSDFFASPACTFFSSCFTSSDIFSSITFFSSFFFFLPV